MAPRIEMIVAFSENGVIGNKGKIPWHISEDLKRFKLLTIGKPVIMGRKTWESLGKPLPNRRNIVVTRQVGFEAEGVEFVSSFQKAIELCWDCPSVMIIGGGQLYKLALPFAQIIWQTKVHMKANGDVRFPHIDKRNFDCVWKEEHPQSETNSIGYTYEKLVRKMDATKKMIRAYLRSLTNEIKADSEEIYEDVAESGYEMDEEDFEITRSDVKRLIRKSKFMLKLVDELEKAPNEDYGEDDGSN